MRTPSADTIAAIATPNGKGAIGVVRLSGPLCGEIARQLTGRPPKARVATHAALLDADGRTLDQALLLYFSGPASYTGEDCLELQCHGGPAVLAGVLERCLALGACAARPGEFTERAYLNGKLDLVQAEAVADLIDAGSRRAVQAALRSLEGAFSREVASIMDDLQTVRTIVEALLDFPEEELGGAKDYGIGGRLEALEAALSSILERAAAGHVLRDGARVVLIGPPNAGKSSLLNALAGEDLAIVSEVPGTTRDVVRAQVTWNGILVELLDTAGLRTTSDQIEQLGIGRTVRSAEAADLVLLVLEIGTPDAVVNEVLEMLSAHPPRMIVVRNKVDLRNWQDEARWIEGRAEVGVSTRTGEGVGVLRSLIATSMAESVDDEGVLMARQRHLDALRRALTAVVRAREVPEGSGELAAEDLRAAEAALGEIVGGRSADALLGDIFSSFCIGK